MIRQHCYVYPYHSGSTNYLCDANQNLVDYIIEEHSESIPPFYPPEFKGMADLALEIQFSMTHDDISLENAKYVFSYLVDISAL